MNFKKNINKLPVGLDFISDLNPVEFEWNRRDGSKMEGKEFGFIAQELKESEENFGIKVPNLIAWFCPQLKNEARMLYFV